MSGPGSWSGCHSLCRRNSLYGTQSRLERGKLIARRLKQQGAHGHASGHDDGDDRQPPVSDGVLGCQTRQGKLDGAKLFFHTGHAGIRRLGAFVGLVQTVGHKVHVIMGAITPSALQSHTRYLILQLPVFGCNLKINGGERRELFTHWRQRALWPARASSKAPPRPRNKTPDALLLPQDFQMPP